MARLTADVRVDYCREAGPVVRTRSGKNAVLELLWDRGRRRLALRVGFPTNEAKLPLQPPLVLTTKRIPEGALSLKLPSVKLHVTEPPMTVQVLVTEADPGTLLKLSNAINSCMACILRKPLQPLSQNVTLPACTSRPGSRCGSQAGSLSRATSCSRDLGADVTSKRQPAQEAEELPPLTAEQQRVVDVVLAGESLFFTGSAGTGKSLVLKHLLRALPAESTFVTASTGLAASALGGTTLHAFAGVGRATDAAAALASAARPDAARRWRRAAVLIIDEVSMVDGALFDLLEGVARRLRGSTAPFGGLQLVLCGDFHQLPPVTRVGEARRFAFACAAWGACVRHCVELTQVFRQADGEFVDLLTRVRDGKAGSSLVAELQARCGQPVATEGIVATKLFTHRVDVDELNESELRALPGEAVRFEAQDAGSALDALRACCPARAALELKVGAQVTLLRNVSHSRGLVNGARGVVEKFVGATIRLPVVRFANGYTTTVSKERWTVAAGGKLLASRTQVPLDLGWAMSVHKCQGLTLDAVQINLERAFEPGMAYVALSRVRSLEGLQMVGGINPRALEAHPQVLDFYARLQRFTGETGAPRKRQRI